MIRMKKISSTTYICKEYKGPLKDIPFDEYIDDLKKWAKKKKAKAYGKPLAFYYYDPKKNTRDDFRVDIGKPIKILKKAGGGYKLKFLPDMKIAARKFEGTPADHPEAFEEIYKYINEKGYRPVGYMMEKFKKVPKKENGELKIKSELQMQIE